MVTPWRKKIKKRLLVVDDHKGALSFTPRHFSWANRSTWIMSVNWSETCWSLHRAIQVCLKPDSGLKTLDLINSNTVYTEFSPRLYDSYIHYSVSGIIFLGSFFSSRL